MKTFHLGLLGIACFASLPIQAHTVTTTLYSTANPTHAIGRVDFTDSQKGLTIQPHLTGLKPGDHGFHIHTTPSCKNHGKAAGGHLDPLRTGKHLGPTNGHGHLGDLPFLKVDKQGRAYKAMTAPRLTTSNLKGHSIMIHEHGDNYKDTPKPLGGGGKRVACGVFK